MLVALLIHSVSFMKLCGINLLSGWQQMTMLLNVGLASSYIDTWYSSDLLRASTQLFMLTAA